MKYLLLIVIISILSCNTEQDNVDYKIKSPYQNTVGDIPFDKNIDDPNFEICFPYFSSPQYYIKGINYDGEMYALKKEVLDKYNSEIIQGQTGFITIRFVVNCKGETGRFRSYTLNHNLEDYSFDRNIEDQILNMTSELSGWKVQTSNDGTPRDYYQYLTFQIIDAQILEITP